MAYNLPDLTGYLVDCRYTLKRVLGAGSFGKVYHARDETVVAPLEFAIKCMVTPPAGSWEAAMQDAEIHIHSLVSTGKHVVRYHRSFEQSGYTWVVMSLCDGDDLYTRIQRKESLYNDYWIRRVLLQVIDGLRQCHDKGIFHRDLKPENIFCSRTGEQVYIGDFGLSTWEAKSREFGVGTICYMAPETIRDGDFPADFYWSELNDIWSVGIIMINLIAGQYPWDQATRSDPSFDEFLYDPNSIAKNLQVHISTECNDIIKKLFRIDPVSRMTLDELHDRVYSMRTFYAPAHAGRPNYDDDLGGSVYSSGSSTLMDVDGVDVKVAEVVHAPGLVPEPPRPLHPTNPFYLTYSMVARAAQN